MDETGASTKATVTWTAAAVWQTQITDGPGNPRMMKGYLNTSNTVPTKVNVTGLTPRSYDVYIYIERCAERELFRNVH